MWNLLSKKLTNNYNEVPLFNVIRKHYIHDEYLIDIRLHPSIKDDLFIKEQLNNLINYIISNFHLHFNNELMLFNVTFNLNHYLKNGEKGSCDLKMHSKFNNDKFIKEELNSLIDYIRANYDMEDLTNL